MRASDGNTILDLLRHGEPVGGRLYRGQRDDPLSDLGWNQMWHAASGETPWQQIITSPLIRCRAFAETLGSRLKVPVMIDARLKEIGFGTWEGKSAAELKALDPKILHRYYHDPLHNRPPGAEPLEHFLERVGVACEDALRQYAGNHLLIVAHAGVIRGMIARILGSPPEATFRINVDNAQLSRIRVTSERPPTLIFHGRSKL